MYIQITTRCNMTCLHCCFDCKAEGKDMKVRTFEQACKLAEKYGSHIAIGGGEPTLHKDFWQFLGTAMSYCPDDTKVWLATNGTNKRISLALAGLAKGGAISCALSLDDYHDRDMVSNEVVEAFDNRNKNHRYQARESCDYREIRDVSMSGELNDVGRAKTSYENNLIGQDVKKGCACDGLFITPDGNIWHCGCQILRYGTVWNPEIPDDYFGGLDEYCVKELNND